MDLKKTDSKLWQYVSEDDKFRNELVQSQYFPEIIKQKVDFSWKDIHPFVSKIEISDHTLPNFIVRFISNYVKDKKFDNILDPWSKYGVLLAAIAENNNNVNGLGIEIFNEAVDISMAISKDKPIEWVNGNSLIELGKMDSNFDAIISSPPFGLSRIRKDFKIGKDILEISDSENNIVLLEALAKLSESGEGVFVLPNRFVFDRRNNVSRNLNKFNLFINSIIALPKKSLSPWTSIDLNIYFISRVPTEKIFLSYLDQDKNPIDLIDQIESHRNGKEIQSGFLIDLNEFTPYFALREQDEIKKEAQKTNAPLIGLSEISKTINIYRRGLGGTGFETVPNTVFLPRMGKRKARTQISDITRSPQHFYQIVLDDDKAMADYIAGFFNTPIGTRVRNSISYGGGGMPSISRESLQEALIILPNIEKQTRIVNAKNDLEDLKIMLENLEENLWSKPYKIQEFESQIAKLTSNESFENWMNSLPFPLASILHRYSISDQISEKVEHLFHFFEASSQFIATLLLSVFYSDTIIFNEYKSRWLEKHNGNMNTFSRADFGGWVVIGERLAKHIRKMLDNKEEMKEILDLFGTDNGDFIQAVASKGLFHVFRITNTYRNDWRGHGGISGEVENKRRLTLLETELRKFREEIKNCFEGFLLYLPQENRHQDGIYFYRVKSIMGSNPLFGTKNIETNSILDDGKLYFQDVEKRFPLKLIPFFIMMSEPQHEKNACYFYSKLEKGSAKWITYHYDQKPEMHMFPDDLGDFLEILRSENE
jgi:hypothetical protein